MRFRPLRRNDRDQRHQRAESTEDRPLTKAEKRAIAKERKARALAARRRRGIHVLVTITVPASSPIDAPLPDEEQRAQEMIGRLTRNPEEAEALVRMAGRETARRLFMLFKRDGDGDAYDRMVALLPEEQQRILRQMNSVWEADADERAKANLAALRREAPGVSAGDGGVVDDAGPGRVEAAQADRVRLQLTQAGSVDHLEAGHAVGGAAAVELVEAGQPRPGRAGQRGVASRGGVLPRAGRDRRQLLVEVFDRPERAQGRGRGGPARVVHPRRRDAAAAAGVGDRVSAGGGG